MSRGRTGTELNRCHRKLNRAKIFSFLFSSFIKKGKVILMINMSNSLHLREIHNSQFPLNHEIPRRRERSNFVLKGIQIHGNYLGNLSQPVKLIKRA